MVSVMKINMDDSRISNITQLRDFLKASKMVLVSLENESIEEKYKFIDKTIDQFQYHTLPKKDKHIVVTYLRKVTGYRNAQLYRLIRRADKGKLMNCM